MAADSLPAEPVRFLADVMLGSLAKWLRILGYDTAYDNRIRDREIVRRCVEEDRVALTRDLRLTERRLLRGRCLLIRSQQLRRQVSQVLEFLEQPVPSSLRSRCVRCNRRLARVDRESVALRVPPYVLRTQDDFMQCPECQRIYWCGTHRERMLEQLSRMARDSPGEAADSAQSRTEPR